MKGALLSIVLVCTVGLPLAVADGAGAEEEAAKSNGYGGKKGVDQPNSPITTTLATSAHSLLSSAADSSTPVLSRTTPSSSASLSTMTNTIDVSSFMTAPSSGIASPTPAAAGYSGIQASMSSATSPASQHTSISRRNLIIILSSVLGFVGILLIGTALVLAHRYRHGRRPFGHGRRGASPINDDEIESWRGTISEQKQNSPSMISITSPAMRNHTSNSIALTHSPGWTWTASPTSTRPALSPSTTVPDTPPYLAKAPNSRPGLTDETIPGENPFVPPMKRQSSRLCKAPPGHGRSKSRRSSLSAKSVWSYSGGIGPNTDSKTNDKMPSWYDPEVQAIGKEISRTDRTEATSSPGTSVYDAPTAGLSPRPSSQLRPWERPGRVIA